MEVTDRVHAFIWDHPTANNANTYLITGPQTVLIDPGHEQLFGHVRDGLERLHLSPRDIDLVLITHGHPDHMEAVRIFLDTTTSVALHHDELGFLRTMGAHYGEAHRIARWEPEILLAEGDLQIGDLGLRVLHTPGHSPGSVCLYWPEQKILFSGDLVFAQGVGRTDLPGGDGETLKQSIRRIAALDVEILLPGHGGFLTGVPRIRENFKEIETFWFGYV